MVRGGESRTDDVGDDVAVFQNFDSTSTTFTHDDAGNLVDDGTRVSPADSAGEREQPVFGRR